MFPQTCSQPTACGVWCASVQAAGAVRGWAASVAVTVGLQWLRLSALARCLVSSAALWSRRCPTRHLSARRHTHYLVTATVSSLFILQFIMHRFYSQIAFSKICLSLKKIRQKKKSYNLFRLTQPTWNFSPYFKLLFFT